MYTLSAVRRQPRAWCHPIPLNSSIRLFACGRNPKSRERKLRPNQSGEEPRNAPNVPYPYLAQLVSSRLALLFAQLEASLIASRCVMCLLLPEDPVAPRCRRR